MTGDRCQLAQKISIKLPLGEKEHPADSCKQIHDSNLNDQKKTTAKSGVYWIKTSLNSNEAVQTFCDMGSGGWTLVGKVSGTVGNIFTKWLIQNHNPDQLKTPLASGKTEYSCLDARVLAVKYASTVMLSSGDNAEGIGSKWVQWGLPPGREVKSWWNHGMGQSAVQSSGTTQVAVKAWNGNSKVRKSENIKEGGKGELLCILGGLTGKGGQQTGIRELKGTVSRNSARLGNYKMPVKLRET